MSKIFLLVLLFPAFILSSRLHEVIENFDDGTVELLSYPGQDIHPNRWTLDSVNTYNNSAYSLKIYGNTWKMESVNFIALDSNDVWQVSAYVDKLGEIQGFGLKDSAHTLFYAFAGTEQLNIQDWVTVYQGAFPLDTWNTYELPVAEDWLNWFGYLPTITAIVFINDRDTDTSAVIYFDEIINITDDLPVAPQVFIWDSIGSIYKNHQGKKSVNVQFYSRIIDPDSENHEYFWYFGDESTSNDENPVHTYLVEDDHEYTVLLQVRDSTNLWGWATCQVLVDSGQSSFPITMNFVGDIMLARRYESPGGIIDTLGVEGIFDPTLPYLGNAADITVANLECPLTTHGTRHPTKPIVFRGRPENVAGLVHAGIDIVSIANNHIIDYGLDGLRETQSVLDSNRILYSGAGANSYEAYLPMFRLKNGVNIAFLASSDRTGQYDNYQPYLNAGYNKPGFANLDTFYLSQQIRGVDTIADLKVVEMHSGSEYGLAPRLNGLSQRTDYNGDEFFPPQVLVPCTSDIVVRHYAIDQGADLVINHHPHIIQGFEVYNGKLIAHSLGNFAFDLDYPETYSSMILNTQIDQTGLKDFSVTPIYIDGYIPRRAKGELGRHILDYLAQRSKELGTYLIVNQDSVTAKIILDTQSLTPTTINNNNQVQLSLQNNYWTSKPIKLSRQGNISSITNITPSRNWQARLGRDMNWLWFGNFEDEGSSMWLLNNVNEFYDTIAYQGTRSLCQIRPMSTLPLITNLENRIICYSDTTCYTLYGNIKTDNSANSSIFVKFYSSRTASNPIGTISLDTVTNTTNWNFYYKDFVPTNGTEFFDIWLRSVSSLTQQSRTWYDNVGIIEWDNWQSIDSFTNIPTPNDYYWIQIRTNQQTNNATLYYEETDYNPQSAISDNTIEPLRFKSFQIYPNPTKSFPTIQYNLLKSSKVVLKIYNSLGQEVKTLVNGMQAQGLKNISWDGRDNQRRALPSGIYFCRLQVADSNQSQKIILLNH